MNSAEALARRLYATYPSLNWRRLCRVAAFCGAAEAALAALGSIDTVFDEIAAYGPLEACRDPGAVIVQRLRWVTEDATARQAEALAASVDAEDRRFSVAVRRAEQLRALVDAGVLDLRSAAEQLEADVDPEIFSVVIPVLKGRRIYA